MQTENATAVTSRVTCARKNMRVFTYFNWGFLLSMKGKLRNKLIWYMVARLGQ